MNTLGTSQFRSLLAVASQWKGQALEIAMEVEQDMCVMVSHDQRQLTLWLLWQATWEGQLIQLNRQFDVRLTNLVQLLFIKENFIHYSSLHNVLTLFRVEHELEHARQCVISMGIKRLHHRWMRCGPALPDPSRTCAYMDYKRRATNNL